MALVRVEPTLELTPDISATVSRYQPQRCQRNIKQMRLQISYKPLSFTNHKNRFTGKLYHCRKLKTNKAFRTKMQGAESKDAYLIFPIGKALYFCKSTLTSQNTHAEQIIMKKLEFTEIHVSRRFELSHIPKSCTSFAHHLLIAIQNNVSRARCKYLSKYFIECFKILRASHEKPWL